MQDHPVNSITELTLNIVTLPHNRFLSVQGKITQQVLKKLENDILLP